MSARRIGVMGGSFDPVHKAHMTVAQDASDKFNLSEVIFIPALIPPHKQHLKTTDVQHRLKMLQLATKQNPKFSVSDMEIKRGGVSYTIDTIKELRSLHPNVTLMLIVGSDTLLDLHSWYKIDELLDLCEVASFIRPGSADIEMIEQKIQWAERHKEKLLANVFQVHLTDISSTQVRINVANEIEIHSLVPLAVEKYIVEHGLYRD